MFNEQSAFNLLENQAKCWPDYADRINQLNTIKTKEFNISNTVVVAQINPARIVSTAARTDEKSIKARKCFLCEENRPQQQQSEEIITGFTLLVNPFPILKGHLTIPSTSHTPQRILSNIGHMLEIAQLLPSFHIFYNGPKCGASAPDHMHFQAVLKGQLPFTNTQEKEIISYVGNAKMLALKGLGRMCIEIESDKPASAIALFRTLYKKLQKNINEEPMMNVFAEFCNSKQLYTIHVFCRKAHRPTQYYSEEDFWMISPGAIDMAGILVLPRLEDFTRINNNVITDIYDQISL